MVMVLLLLQDGWIFASAKRYLNNHHIYPSLMRCAFAFKIIPFFRNASLNQHPDLTGQMPKIGSSFGYLTTFGGAGLTMY